MLGDWGDSLIIEGQAGSIGDLVAEVRRIATVFKAHPEEPEELWFRGQHSCDWELLPNLYRSDTQKYHYAESALLDRFQALATPIVHQLPSSSWEWYFLARHHGLPSRLLDWTESLFVAGYFAVAGHLPKNRLDLDEAVLRPSEAPFFEECPTVWIIDAGSLNVGSIGIDKVVVPEGPRSEPYLTDNLEKERSEGNAKPIALMPARRNPRIVAQHGMFTLHGHEPTSIDALASSDARIKLGRIRIDKSCVAQMAADLRLCGMHRLTTFPELDSVAEHVCWIYQSSR
jgi:hypothetical protein